MAVAVVALGWYGGVRVQEWLYQRSAEREMRRVPTSTPETEKKGQSGSTAIEDQNAPSFPARLEVPRLGLSALVKQGVDDATLRRAVGHVPESAAPGASGNTALAGHRDTFFRPLKKVRLGDRVRITTPRGVHEYVVRETKVVGPADVSVLRPTREKTLTLITCYPFNFIGSAPKRFIVRASSVETPIRADAAAEPVLTYASVLAKPTPAKQKARKPLKHRKPRGVGAGLKPTAIKAPPDKAKKGFWRKLGRLFS